ncbi:MAG: hypothetical protein KAU20_01060 [Nanoarchaeota archaeon]|nr:hypothetical protein [Nanoarchaeota archaeon]
MSKLTLDELKSNMDEWVKEMNSHVVKLKEVPSVMIENTDNIQHNYELVTELRSEIDELKQEIKLLKLMQLVALKEKRLKS